MEKLYDRIYWYNNTTPALNASNLNSMSKAIDDIDDRVIQIADDVVDKVADIEQWHDDCYEYQQSASQSASDASASASSALTSETNAETHALDSEAWAVGKKNGVDVPNSDPRYQNNSKWYAMQSGASATQALRSAQDCEDIKEEINGIVGATNFTVDFTTGELIYTNEATFSFSINQTNGNLEWEVVA